MMKTTLSKVKKLNRSFTNRIIELQGRGYLYDFLSEDKKQFICVQDSSSFMKSDVSLKLIDQVFDRLTNCYKRIHLVETTSGHKGLLIEERNFAG